MLGALALTWVPFPAPTLTTAHHSVRGDPRPSSGFHQHRPTKKKNTHTHQVKINKSLKIMKDVNLMLLITI